MNKDETGGMTKQKAYLETSVISYLTARPKTCEASRESVYPQNGTTPQGRRTVIWRFWDSN